ncbi:hypothetical protein HU200_026914 [Digitaria exilis]|uniref:Uncharacterized protein n=1 Tax=Digitaria exilis TaxID=1010633 RepID=A0A835BYD0_9POAL|nr:hypothetical protein HU200_026914 [Digitaria exilis]
MSPAVRVGAPFAPGTRGAKAETEEEAVVVWRELRGRAVALAAAAEERAALASRIEDALEFRCGVALVVEQVRREALRQEEELGELRRRLDLQHARAEEALVGRRRTAEAVERGKERLQEQIERVLPLSRALTAAHRRVQEAKEALSGHKARHEDLQRLLRTRQRCMVAQVAALYPVRVFHDLPQHGDNSNGQSRTLSEETRAFSGAHGTHVPSVIKSPQGRALTIFGWQIMNTKRKQKNYSDKELQRSATVLGYAAHAVLLIAFYLDVPLRYPLHFGGSRSYVSDRLPSAETATAASTEHPSTNNTISELSEYPLFLECQEDDSTRASYAIYLLNKIWLYMRLGLCMFASVLLLYLLYKFSPGFFAFLLSTSPVIICTSILLGLLLNYGGAHLPEINQDRRAPEGISAPKFLSSPRNKNIKAVPAVKENIIREASFGRDSNKCTVLDESVRPEKMLTSVPSIGDLKTRGEKVSKDASLSNDKSDEYSSENVREDALMVTRPNYEGTVCIDSQSGEVVDVSEHKAVDGVAGKCKWGRAFSVRRRKKLADIQIEAIDSVVDNQVERSLFSPLTGVGSHDGSSGLNPDNAERHSPDVSTADTGAVVDETKPLLGADCSCPDRFTNNELDKHSIISSHDSQVECDSNDVAGNNKAKDDGEQKKGAGAEPAFLWTADNEKNVMDLGYSEMERYRRLESLMVRRKSRKNIRFDPDEDDLSHFRPQLQPISVSARRMNPFADDTEIPGSAPPILHPQKSPFDFLSEESTETGVPACHNLEPRESMAVSHQSTLFKRHESFNVGRPPQRHGPSFKPCFVLDKLSFEEAGSSSFQRQFSDRSVSRLSIVSECDTVSSVGDQEHNDLIRNYIRGVRESSSLLRQDSDLVYPGNECSGGISFGDNETLNAVIC